MLTETQLAGLKKGTAPIKDDDVRRVLTALGLRKTRNPDPAGERWALPIVDNWSAHAHVDEAKREPGIVYYRVDFYVWDDSEGRRIGTVHRFEDANQLQLRGAQVMQQMFLSVDDLAPLTCSSCGAPALTWDGAKTAGSRKAGHRCGACGWSGRGTGFKALSAYL